MDANRLEAIRAMAQNLAAPSTTTVPDTAPRADDRREDGNA